MKYLIIVFCILNFNAYADLNTDAYHEYKKGNKTRAVKLFTRACEKGNMKSCGSLAYMYYTGDGVDKNKKKATSVYSKMCDAGDIILGCYSLAKMYDTGEGTKKNTAKANTLYLMACSSGSGIACNNLAINYHSDNRKNEAIKLFKKACDFGYADGCSNYSLATK